MPRRAFTLIELLIAFAISTVLLGAIYIFYVGIMKTGGKTRKMAFLNMKVDNKLEKLTRDLKSAIEILELHPRQIRLKRYKLPKGELRSVDLETKRYETIEYRMEEREGRFVFFRQRGFENPKELFRVRECNEEIFRGYVLIPTASKNGGKHSDGVDDFPQFEIFDTVSQSSTKVQRIPLVKITFDLATATDDIHVVSKVFIPQVFARIVEPDWNAE